MVPKEVTFEKVMKGWEYSVWMLSRCKGRINNRS
jgi:hypothetical protein